MKGAVLSLESVSFLISSLSNFIYYHVIYCLCSLLLAPCNNQVWFWKLFQKVCGIAQPTQTSAIPRPHGFCYIQYRLRGGRGRETVSFWPPVQHLPFSSAHGLRYSALGSCPWRNRSWVPRIRRKAGGSKKKKKRTS